MKYEVDIAAALSVQAAQRVLCLDVNTPQFSVAIAAMRRAKLTLEECELDYEEHTALCCTASSFAETQHMPMRI